jgi:peptidoglycan LD-endopeptidase CwlK
MRYSARNLAALEGLNPVAKQTFSELLLRLNAEGEDICITDGYRSAEEQDALYAQGRTKPGKIVTNARGGYSLHNFGCAIDFVPVSKTGAFLWSGKEAERRFKEVGEVAKSMGIEWGGDWKTFPDKPHVQFTQGLTIADFRAGRTLQPERGVDPSVMLAKAVNALKWAKGLRRAMLERLIARLKKML